MRNFDETTFSSFGDHPCAALLLDCYKARYAELMSPDDVAEAVAEEGAAPPAEGWLVFAELERQDIERLTAERLRSLNLSVRTFDDGLPVVVLSVLAQAVRYVWVIPMWEVDAQVWLRDAVDRGRIALAMNAVDAPLSVVLTTTQAVFPYANRLLAASKVAKQPEGLAHLYCMFNAGMQILREETVQRTVDNMPPPETRLMVVGRGDNAAHLMNMFTTGVELALSLQPSASKAIQ